MNLIDRVRRLNNSFLDRFAKQRFVFHHVPKCGGTSVGRALRMRYLTSQATVKPEPSFQAYKAFSGRTDTEQMLLDANDLRKQMMLYLLYDDVRCVSLHAPFSSAAYREFHQTYKFITILREPVARFISHYNWSSRRPGSHGFIEEDFNEFLDSDRAQRMGAEYVEMFADLPNSADIRTADAVEMATSNLAKFDVIGRLDDLEGFARDIHTALGVRVKIGHANKTLGDAQVTARDIGPEQLEKICEICAPDIAVWNALFGPN
ncbi:sulfotransferase family protein [Ruegeria aquimaris]|uniref:Sulfotransferase family protein n=1 Tax=Ruegeria aquimaris TaxID=2984333 RepID=A0ABT3AE69_9RHOB|nr:sulfotransferase family protein [Ruegeria sp. XHP0148]MCV2886862.1 sulfotransferase family protein [Ruegeria sp. XHP0148]